MNHLKSHQSHDFQIAGGRLEREGAAKHQGAAITNEWHTIQQAGPFSANGAASFQPGATPQERRTPRDRVLKARANRRAVGSGFQPLAIFGLVNQGVALGLEFGNFLPVSRSEPTMVAVGLSPRTATPHTIRRRGATAERSKRTVAFNRRSATRDHTNPPLRGLKSTATIMTSLREATQGVALGWNESGALPFGNAAIAALDAESAEVQ